MAFGRKKEEENSVVRYVMDEDTAKQELERIDEFFDAEYGDDKNVIIEHIRKGMLYLDDSQKKVIYKLNSPIEKQNGDSLTEMKLRALNCREIMDNGKKIQMKGNDKSEYFVSPFYDL